MRFMTVNLMRVKPGRVSSFTDAWRMIVAAHKKANLDEHWAVYQVESGMPDATSSSCMRTNRWRSSMRRARCIPPPGYRDAVGESGRRQMDDAYRNGLEMT